MSKMKIFRAAQAAALSEVTDDHEMNYAPMPPATQAGMVRLVEAGINDGHVTKCLFAAPGFSLSYAWFKPNFPLARHSHDSDCLYYIVSGSIRLGTEALGAGDGFFLPENVPYTYAIGDKGVEILEFRHTSHFEFRAAGGSEAYWKKAEATISANRDVWQQLVPPRAAQ